MGQGSHLPGTQWTLGSGARHHPTHIRAGHLWQVSLPRRPCSDPSSLPSPPVSGPTM